MGRRLRLAGCRAPPPVAELGRPFQAHADQCLRDTPPPGRRVDREHPELTLAGLGDLAPRRALRAERHRPGEPVLDHRDVHLGVAAPADRVAQVRDVGVVLDEQPVAV